MSEIRALDRKLDHLAALIENSGLIRTRVFGPCDPADRDLVLAIAEVMRDRDFTSSHILQLAQADAALADALLAADICNAKQLGWLLKRLDGVEIEGVMIKRVSDGRSGAIWRVCLVRHVNA